jgi:hypothetical protein
VSGIFPPIYWSEFSWEAFSVRSLSEKMIAHTRIFDWDEHSQNLTASLILIGHSRAGGNPSPGKADE